MINLWESLPTVDKSQKKCKWSKWSKKCTIWNSITPTVKIDLKCSVVPKALKLYAPYQIASYCNWHRRTASRTWAWGERSILCLIDWQGKLNHQEYILVPSQPSRSQGFDLTYKFSLTSGMHSFLHAREAHNFNRPFQAVNGGFQKSGSFWRDHQRQGNCHPGQKRHAQRITEQNWVCRWACFNESRTRHDATLLNLYHNTHQSCKNGACLLVVNFGQLVSNGLPGFKSWDLERDLLKIR